MKKQQKIVKKFVHDRNWEQFHNPKDLLLGIVEEVGELRNIVKWEQDPQVLQKVLVDNKDEVEDGVGDILWLLSSLSNRVGVDMEKALDRVIKENKKRFPLKNTRNKHTNLYLGGKDNKYPVKKAKGKHLKYTEYTK